MRTISIKNYFAALLVLCSVLLNTKVSSQCKAANYPPLYSVHNSSGWTQHYLHGAKYTTTIGGLLTGLGYNGLGTNNAIRLALYTDNAGNPGTLVAFTNPSTVGTGTITIPVITQTLIPAGTYWIMTNQTISGGKDYTNNPSTTSNYRYIAWTFATNPPNSASWTNYTHHENDFYLDFGPNLLISGNATICNGSTTTLTASGASTYTWNTTATTNTIAVSPSVTTSYTVSSGATGCTATAVVEVTVNASPTVAVTGTAAICSGQSTTLTAGGATTYSWSTGATTASVAISPSVSTSYTVTGTSSGCSDTIVQTVSVTATPTLAVSGPSVVCLGSSINLITSGASNYTWSTGANTSSVAVTPTANVTYTVTGSTSGCGGNTASASVTVNPLPTVSALTSNTLICGPPFQQTATLTANGASTYTWNPGGTGTSIAVSPSVTSSYTVTGTDANGCTNIAVITQSVSTCAGFTPSANEKMEAIRVFPNPFSSSFAIIINQGPAKLEIINCLGAVVFSTQLTDEHNEINMSQYSNGIYFIKLTSERGSILKKVVKD